jgi:hypothetical protein
VDTIGDVVNDVGKAVGTVRTVADQKNETLDAMNKETMAFLVKTT